MRRPRTHDRFAVLRRPQAFEAALRVALVPILWAGLFLPRAPRWAATEHAAFHAAAAVLLAWTVFTLVAALKRPAWAERLSRAALAADMAAIGVLAWFTGGWVSPFLALVPIALLALLLGSAPRRTLGASLAAGTALGIGVAVTATGALSVPAAFATGGGTPLRFADNPVYLATLAVLGGVMLLLNLATLVFLAGRTERDRARLARAVSELAAADRALDASFRRIEEISTTSNRLAEVARAATGLDANPPPQYRH
jgi:hypothetical protein